MKWKNWHDNARMSGGLGYLSKLQIQGSHLLKQQSMTNDEFLKALQDEVSGYNKAIATENGEWIVKGFIDIYKNVYTITIDTKVVSKVMEILLIPAFEEFAQKCDLRLELTSQQNFYPDLSFTHNKTGRRYAVDIKSTFLDSANKIKSMTLGAFTGYFRNRTSTKNTMYPYGSYSGHFVLGVIYSQVEKKPDEKAKYHIDDLEKIESVVKNFQFFAQPKYRIASARPGSGNTKNIGATTDIDKLINGNGVFAEFGEETYDDYWMHYLTKDMAKEIDVVRPYTNLASYQAYKLKGVNVLAGKEELVKKLSAEDDAEAEAADTENITEDEGTE